MNIHYPANPSRMQANGSCLQPDENTDSLAAERQFGLRYWGIFAQWHTGMEMGLCQPRMFFQQIWYQD